MEPEKENIMLYKSEAEGRKMLVDEVFYDLVLALPKGDEFSGYWKISFTLKSLAYSPEQLFIDFEYQDIYEFSVNGNILDQGEHIRNKRVYLTPEIMNLGKNWITLQYVNTFKKTGTGFHKFIDPVDGLEYSYTQFAIFHAHRVFPCFDQPDLKAMMHLVWITSPEKTVVSNWFEYLEKLSEKDPDFWMKFCDSKNMNYIPKLFESGYKIVWFDLDFYLSTYLFAVIWGPYDIVERHTKIRGKDGKFKMRFMCRQSLKEKAWNLYNHMFDAVVTGIQWYSKFFGTPFPWSKYDQIFCPEFKYGAMENVGAITLMESYIKDERINEVDLTWLQNTVLHELCHMWFGNLVTMKWWDDLWLNEAFATYMSYLCTEENENLREKTPGQWIMFNNKKAESINWDWLTTNHPIVKDTPHTDSADDALNSITYGKGSAFLKQLVHIIGKDALSEACKIYFKKFKFQNTTLEDFINWLIDTWSHTNELMSFDLRQFCVSHLTTKGINSLYIKVCNYSKCNVSDSFDSKIFESFDSSSNWDKSKASTDVSSITQNKKMSLDSDTSMDKEDKDKSKIIVEFNLVKGCYSDAINLMKLDYLLIKRQEIILQRDNNSSDENEIHYHYEITKHSIILQGNSEPQIVVHEGYDIENTFVLGNANDNAYIQSVLSERFLKELSKGLLSKIPDSINRIIIWRGLISNVSKLHMKSTDFFKIIIENVWEEDDVILLDTLLPLFGAWVVWYIPNEMFEYICKKIFNKLYRKMISLPSSKQDLKAWFKSAIFNYLYSEEHLELATDWLESGFIIDRKGVIRRDLPLDVNERYQVLKKIFASPNIPLEEKNFLLEREIWLDQSDKTKRLAMYWDASIPDPENKARIWEIITHPFDYNLSIYEYNSYLDGFFKRSQQDLCNEYVGKYIQELANFAECSEKDFMTTFVRGAWPPIR
jgi:aminopeptidase N